MNNIYLDKISDTLFSKGHIPPMVLITKKINSVLREGQTLEIGDFNILDGLQRTFRIKRIWDSVMFYYDELEGKKISRSELIKKYESKLSTLDIDPAEILRLSMRIENLNLKKSEFVKLYKDNTIWIEIWVGLNKKKQIGKMLTLNAGHKPMQKRHQLELLFLNLEDILSQEGQGLHEGFQIIRERDVSVATFQKNKEPYEYHLSILIASVISYVQGKVVIPGQSLVKEIHDKGNIVIDSEDDFDLDQAFEEDFYEPFVKFLITLDDIVKYDEDVLKWSARETILPGIMAALGRIRIENNLAIGKAISQFTEIIRKSKAKFFNVKDFEFARSQIPVQKVNVGKYLRDLVYEGSLDAITNSRDEIRWKFVSKKMNSQVN